MSAENTLPPASLASLEPYPVPRGATLIFKYTRETTDGFMRGDIIVSFQNEQAAVVIARSVPVTGTSKSVRAIGDYAMLFPDPIEVESSRDAA